MLSLLIKLFSEAKDLPAGEKLPWMKTILSEVIKSSTPKVIKDLPGKAKGLPGKAKDMAKSARQKLGKMPLGKDMDVDTLVRSISELEQLPHGEGAEAINVLLRKAASGAYSGLKQGIKDSPGHIGKALLDTPRRAKKGAGKVSAEVTDQLKSARSAIGKTQLGSSGTDVDTLLQIISDIRTSLPADQVMPAIKSVLGTYMKTALPEKITAPIGKGVKSTAGAAKAAITSLKETMTPIADSAMGGLKTAKAKVEGVKVGGGLELKDVTQMISDIAAAPKEDRFGLIQMLLEEAQKGAFSGMKGLSGRLGKKTPEPVLRLKWKIADQLKAAKKAAGKTQIVGGLDVNSLMQLASDVVDLPGADMMSAVKLLIGEAAKGAIPEGAKKIPGKLKKGVPKLAKEAVGKGVMLVGAGM